MTTESQVRKYVRKLYKQIYKRLPSETEEREFAKNQMMPVMFHLFKESQLKKEVLE